MRLPAHLGRRLFALALAIVVFYGGITFVQVTWAARNATATPAAPAAVVLGAAQYDGRPSPALRGRLDRAAELYQLDSVDLVVVTGGGQEGDRTTQAKAGYDYLRETAGIPDERLRLEVDGTSTFEELAAVARFLRSEGIADVVLVTDAYHARRAQLIADEVGLAATVATTSGTAPLDRLVRETAAVAVGQIIGFRRLERL